MVQGRAISGIIGTLFFLGVAHAQSKKEAYELDERCGLRAAALFKKEYEGFTLNGRIHQYSYRNHYSARLNKCFFLLLENSYPEKSFDDRTRTLELYDLNENNRYGLFIGSTKGNPPPAECEMRGRTCNSEAEWVDLTSPYMDD